MCAKIEDKRITGIDFEWYCPSVTCQRNNTSNDFIENIMHQNEIESFDIIECKSSINNVNDIDMSNKITSIPSGLNDKHEMDASDNDDDIIDTSTNNKNKPTRFSARFREKRGKNNNVFEHKCNCVVKI
eukprot:357239_1